MINLLLTLTILFNTKTLASESVTECVKRTINQADIPPFEEVMIDEIQLERFARRLYSDFGFRISGKRSIEEIKSDIRTVEFLLYKNEWNPERLPFPRYFKISARFRLIRLYQSMGIFPKNSTIYGKKIYKFVRAYKAKFGRNPSVDEISEEVGISTFDVNRYLQNDPRSLNVQLGNVEDGLEAQDFLTSTENHIEVAANKNLVAEAIKVLNPQERKVIDLILLSEKPITPKEAAAQLGVSRSRVFQIRESALQKMRSFLEKAEDKNIVLPDEYPETITEASRLKQNTVSRSFRQHQRNEITLSSTNASESGSTRKIPTKSDATHSSQSTTHVGASRAAETPTNQIMSSTHPVVRISSDPNPIPFTRISVDRVDEINSSITQIEKKLLKDAKLILGLGKNDKISRYETAMIIFIRRSTHTFSNEVFSDVILSADNLARFTTLLGHAQTKFGRNYLQLIDIGIVIRKAKAQTGLQFRTSEFALAIKLGNETKALKAASLRPQQIQVNSLLRKIKKLTLEQRAELKTALETNESLRSQTQKELIDSLR